MAKRKPKTDALETAASEGPHVGAAADPTSFDPSTFDAPAPADAVALVAATDEAASPPPAAQSRRTDHRIAPPQEPRGTGADDASRSAHTTASVDPDGRVTYTVPAGAAESRFSAERHPEGEGEAARPLPNPFGVRADHDAGVGLLEDRRFKQMQIRFRELCGGPHKASSVALPVMWRWTAGRCGPRRMPSPNAT